MSKTCSGAKRFFNIFFFSITQKLSQVTDLEEFFIQTGFSNFFLSYFYSLLHMTSHMYDPRYMYRYVKIYE